MSQNSDKNGENEVLFGENELKQLSDLGQVTLTEKKDEKKPSIHCLVVVGSIEGHQELPSGTKTTKYEHVLPALAAIEQSDEISGLLILINTAGGDVEAGLAIAEVIAGMKKPTASLVLGGGHSIGVPIAVAARHSFISPSAAMTVHPVRLSGMIIGVPETYEYLMRTQERIIDFVCRHSEISERELRSLMLATGRIAGDSGTVLDAEKAVKSGLIGAVGTLSDALRALGG